MTNEQLVRQYYDGDEAALEKLYHKNIGLMRGERSNVASARTAETELSKVDVVLTGSAVGRIIQKGGARPLPFGR